MTLRERMVRDARTTFTRPDHFGETAIYLFKAGGQRTVRCDVVRLDVEPSAPNIPQIARLRAIVSIPRNATDGIETYAPGDKMQLAMRIGASAVTVRLKHLISQDEGMITFEVEA